MCHFRRVRHISVLVTTGLIASHSEGIEFDRVYALRPDESVFAYARIDPSGNVLAYSSEKRDAHDGRYIRKVTVADMRSRQILFTDAGVDAYWSNDGSRMIYYSSATRSVNIWQRTTGVVAKDVAPIRLGDYFSWAEINGKPVIFTILNNYYALDGDKARLPAAQVVPCPRIGTGERPLASHDGRRVTTFAMGTVVIRSPNHCNDIYDTGIPGAKADFSFDGRYVAMHNQKADASGNDIVVVDLRRKTLRNLTRGLTGTSLFPSWTRDGRICFRYDGSDFRGFVIAKNVLAAPAVPLSTVPHHLSNRRTWTDIFPSVVPPNAEVTLVMIWGTWSAHSPNALSELQAVRALLKKQAASVEVLTALEPGTRRSDAQRIWERNHITVPQIALTQSGFAQTEARNQIPTTLLFHGGLLVSRHLGPMSAEEMRIWIAGTRNTLH
ncbi:MAG: hypothetical protein JWM95_3616 [Gemmatimonadetes bacterium]|nr:hypothetical protein [Gemmatimonadota bacterium]